jgi:hypothetical protein
MLRSLAACSVAVTLVACSGHRVARRVSSATATPLPSVGTLQMVKPPVAVYHEKDGYVELSVRLNRPIEDSDLVPDEGGARYASIEALQGESLFGATADVRFPTCYSDAVLVGSVPAAGTHITVELKLGPGQSMKADAVFQHFTHDTHPVLQLGCPRDPDGHVCSGKIDAKYLTIEPETAYATSCGVARKVMTSVGRWANPHRCAFQLCVSKHRMNRGFRCDAYFHNGGEGPPAWRIECTKDRAVVTAYADESGKR